MYDKNKILIADADHKNIHLLPRMANRHGLISGATGTGKTVTLKVLAESFSDAGVPVFLADVKGDLSGMCRPGSMSGKLETRIREVGLDPQDFPFRSYPTVFWDIYGETGIPLRTTISEMGPVLLSRLLELNPTQTDILTIVFQIADERQLLLIDTKDLKSMLQYVSDNNKEFSQEYGNISKQSVNAILRHLVALESRGGKGFFAEPALNIGDWFAPASDGRGNIHVLDCRKLVNDGTLYSAFLLWMLSELFETLPETGDLEKPRMVFFFDEAHLLFRNISKSLLEKTEQIVRLIRSRGIGIYFITQDPGDIPDSVLGQLGNKFQHALHAYTPSDEKAVRAAAASFRPNPAFSTKEAITCLGIGEALVSVLDEDGVPGMVEKCRILPPQSLMGPIDDAERQTEIGKHALTLKYRQMEDRDSAYEFFQRQKQQETLEQEKAAVELQKEREAQKAAEKKAKEEERAAQKRQRALASGVGRVAGTAAGTIGREIGNNLGEQMGGRFGKRLGGNLGASLGRSILGTLLKLK